MLSPLLLLAGCSMMDQTLTTEQMKDGGFWNRYFVFPVSWALDNIADLLWGQYGLAILVITLFVRFIILPLTLKQYRSSRAMQALQPELKKLKAKYKDDTKKQQEETMKLFQQNGVNPLAGCFPLIVQMPVLIALYNAIYRNVEIRDHTFLAIFQLGTPDTTYILPILAALTTFIQQKMMSKHTPTQMQALMFIFPVLIFIMSMQFPSALPLYWVYSNLFTIVQTYFIYRDVPNKGPQKGGLAK